VPLPLKGGGTPKPAGGEPSARPARGKGGASSDASSLARVCDAVASGRLDVNQVVSQVMRAKAPPRKGGGSPSPVACKNLSGGEPAPQSVRRSRSPPSSKAGGRGLKQLTLVEVGLRTERLLSGGAPAPGTEKEVSSRGPETKTGGGAARREKGDGSSTGPVARQRFVFPAPTLAERVSVGDLISQHSSLIDLASLDLRFHPFWDNPIPVGVRYVPKGGNWRNREIQTG